MWFAAIFNLLQVFTQPGKNFGMVPFTLIDLTLQFVESEVHDIVMVQLLVAQILAEFQPDAVQQVNFLGGQSG